MGGSGSTRWTLHWKKMTVEECLTLSIKELGRANDKPFSDLISTSGSLTWNSGASVGYELRRSNNRLLLILSYTFTDGKEKRPKTPEIPLSSTSCNYGGYRYWMHCPQCKRRVTKLYMAWGNFACRKCHDLTYTSAQEAHRFDSLGAFGIDFKRLDELMDAQALLDKWDARKRLTKGERRKIANHMDLPLFMIRSRWYTLKTRARRELEACQFAKDLLK